MFCYDAAITTNCMNELRNYSTVMGVFYTKQEIIYVYIKLWKSYGK